MACAATYQDHPDFAFYLESGCEDWSDALGIQKMPAGYRMLLDADRMYFSWFHLPSGRESVNHWCKWAVWRGARDDAAAQTDREEPTDSLGGAIR
jgi:hypothetical protein